MLFHAICVGILKRMGGLGVWLGRIAFCIGTGGGGAGNGHTTVK